MDIPFSERKKEYDITYGIGDNLLSLSNYMIYEKKSIKLNNSIFYDFFLPSYKKIPIQYYNTLYSVIQLFKPSTKFSEFDEEYSILNKKYQLAKREGIHLRFTKLEEMKELNILSNIVKLLIKKKKENKKYFIAMDNYFFYKKYCENILKNNDVFILKNIKRAHKPNLDIHGLIYSNEDIIIQSIKEAYFISKCEKYIHTTGYFGNILIPFLRHYFKFNNNR